MFKILVTLSTAYATYHKKEYWHIAGYHVKKPNAWKKKTSVGGRFYEKNSISSEFYLSKDKRTW